MQPLARRPLQRMVAMVMALALVLGLVPAPALAAGDGVTRSLSGVDSLEPSAEAWELLRVDAHDGSPLYVDIIKTDEDGKGTYLAHRQKYDLGDATTNGPEGTGSAIAHIVSVALEDGSPAESVYADPQNTTRYSLHVWDQARGGTLLYDAMVYPVYAKLTDEAQAEVEGYKLMGIRTASGAEKASRNLGVGTVLYRQEGADGARVAYALQWQGRTADGKGGVDNVFDTERNAFVATYVKTADDSVTGSVTYKTDDGQIVRTETFAGIGEEGMTVPVDQSFFADGVYYRTLSGFGRTERLTVGRPNVTVRVVPVTGMADASAYQVTIRFEAPTGEGEEPRVLWTDTVDVHGDGFQYSLPTAFSAAADSGVAFYSLDGVVGNDRARSAYEWGNPVVLTGDLDESAFDVDEQNNRVLHARYTSSDVTKEATFTVVEVDGTNATEIGRKTGTVTPEQGFTYEPAAFEHNGTTYVPAASNTSTIAYTWDDLTQGRDLMVYVYYVPEGYVPGEAYDIQVRYQNVADGSILRTQTYSVNAEMTDFLTVVGDERFSEDGEEYVRLPGQETGIRHAFFSPTRVYTIYYRNVNDQLNANTVIRRTQIIDSPRAAVAGTVGGGVTAAPVAAAAPATGAAAAPADAGVAPGDGAVVLNDDGNPLANPEGLSTAEERIADDENPLASGAVNMPLVGGIAAVAGLAAILLLFALWRKKKAASDSENA